MSAMAANDTRMARIPAARSSPARCFTAQNLASAEILYALPLVRATWPAMDRAAWQGFVACFCANSALSPAITALSDRGGGLCGLFASRIDDRLGKRILTVPLFTVVDIGNSLEPVRALIDAVEARAAENKCSGIDIELGEGQTRLRERLLRLGRETRFERSGEVDDHTFTVH